MFGNNGMIKKNASSAFAVVIHIYSPVCNEYKHTFSVLFRVLACYNNININITPSVVVVYVRE